jgi:MFS family permease
MLFTKVALLTGWHLFGVGIGGIIFVPSSRIWGKRHAFLIGNVIIIIASAWNGASGMNYKSAAAARFFQGVGLAPFEGLLNAAVGDMYHVHERGTRMAVTNFCVFGGSFLTPVIAGRIARTMGWPWTFYFIAIFAGVMLPFMFFFVPETAYKRDERLDTDLSGVAVIGGNRLAVTKLPSAEGVTAPASATHSADDEKDMEAKGDPTALEEAAIDDGSAPPAKMTYWESLRLFNGKKTDESFIKLFLRPFPLMFHPAIMWVCIYPIAYIANVNRAT